MYNGCTYEEMYECTMVVQMMKTLILQWLYNDTSTLLVSFSLQNLSLNGNLLTSSSTDKEYHSSHLYHHGMKALLILIVLHLYSQHKL